MITPVPMTSTEFCLAQGRTGFGYTLFQTPRQIATMWREGGWTPQEVADHFGDVLGQHLQPVGMGDHPLLGKKG